MLIVAKTERCALYLCLIEHIIIKWFLINYDQGCGKAASHVQQWLNHHACLAERSNVIRCTGKMHYGINYNIIVRDENLSSPRLIYCHDVSSTLRVHPDLSVKNLIWEPSSCVAAKSVQLSVQWVDSKSVRQLLQPIISGNNLFGSACR